jgi:hypothetical protein
MKQKRRQVVGRGHKTYRWRPAGSYEQGFGKARNHRRRAEVNSRH